MYVLAGVPRAALWPWGYAALAAALWPFQRRGRTWALQLQLALSLVIPWLLMLDLGGFRPSGAVMIWSLIAAVGALLTYGVRRAVGWVTAYAALALVASAFKGRLPGGAGTPSDGWVAAFFFMNIIGVTLMASTRPSCPGSTPTAASSTRCGPTSSTTPSTRSTDAGR